ncbi:MAG: hypothetical protein NC037_00420 [Bacteroides sp.]|nr:hypothetical protein [Bacillota bacterium]MCM1393635.1 hypothetical protein [[Eubacterium] siraeum]MCM1454981.1 hypothetical protein [Bacteroides sp.]
MTASIKSGNNTIGFEDGRIDCIVGEHGELTADLFTFSNSADKYEWTLTENFENGIATQYNHQIYTKHNANDDLLIQEVNDSSFIFKFGINAWGEQLLGNDSADKNWFSMATNYKIDDFLKNFIDDTNYKVKVDASATISSDDTTQEIYFGIAATSEPYSGQNAYDKMYGQNCKSQSNGILCDKNYVTTDREFNTIDGCSNRGSGCKNCPGYELTLTDDNEYIAIMAGSWFKYLKNADERTITISKLALNFTVTYVGEGDYNTAANSVGLSYKSATGSFDNSIDNLYATLIADAQWATDEAKLMLNVENLNAFGNSVVFQDAEDKEYLLTFYKDGKLALYTADGKAGEISSASDKITANIKTELDETEIYISYSVADGNGVITIEFEGYDSVANCYPTVAWRTDFTLTEHPYTSLDSVDGGTSTDTANIFIDRNDPDAPVFSGNKLVQNSDYTLAANRQWLTSYNGFAPTLAFDDFLANDDYNGGYTLYTAVKHFNSASAFAAFKNTNSIESGYKNINNSNYNATYSLDAFATPSFGSTVAIDLLSGKGAGLRLIYVWVVDQAGRASQLNSYYVLADATNYSVSASIDSASTGTVSASGTSVKRGESVTFTITLQSGYVPYRFKNGSADLLVNDTANQALVKADADNDLVSVAHTDDSDTYVVTYTFEDDSIDELSTTAFSFTASARKKVVIASLNTSYTTTYGIAVDLNDNLTVNDDTAKSLFAFTYYNENGNTLFGDGTSAPVDAGSYSAAVSFPSDNASYVLSSSLSDRISITVNKISVTITPNATQSYYGDEILLGYTQTGFRAIDGETLSVSLKLSGVGSGFVSVGSYNIVNDGELVVKKGAQNSQNYDVKLNATPVKHTVNKRNVALNVTSGQYSVVEYGISPNPNGVNIQYTLATADNELSTYIANVVNGKLKLTYVQDTDEGINTKLYSRKYVYDITLENADDDNVNITIGDDAQYIIYVGANPNPTPDPDPDPEPEPESVVVETENASVTVENGNSVNRLEIEEVTDGNGTHSELWNSISASIADIDDKAEVTLIVKLNLYLDDTPVADLNGNISVSIKIPEALGDLQDVTIYVENSNGDLQCLSDYTISSGRLEYAGDCLGALVFAKDSDDNSGDDNPTNPENPENPTNPDDPDDNTGDNNGDNNENPDNTGDDNTGDNTGDDNIGDNGGNTGSNVGDNTGDVENAPNGLKTWQIAVIAVACAVVAIGAAVVTVVLIRKSKKK